MYSDWQEVIGSEDLEDSPIQIVRNGMAMKTGVVMAPTVYDQHPEQYIRRSNRRKRHWNSGVRVGFRMI